jgi:hypothetical protein
MERTYTRREFGAYTLGMGLAGGAMASMSSPAEAAEADYETDAAGVPRPSDADELQSALNDSPRSGLVECPSGTTYRPGSTIEIPGRVQLDATGATIVPQHDGAAVSVSKRDPAKLRGGTIDLGSGGGIGVLNSTGETGKKHKWDSICYGTTVLADPGSGAIGFDLQAVDGENTDQPYHAPTLMTNGVDVPININSPSSGGFVTSVCPSVKAVNYETLVKCRGGGSTTIAHSLVWLRPGTDPGSSANAVLDFAVNDGVHFMTAGYTASAEAHDVLLNITETRDGNQGGHSFMSYNGYSSRRNPDLVRNTTDDDSTAVIDCSDLEYRQ